jgi:squalene-associated FAD-dependent desaturase
VAESLSTDPRHVVVIGAGCAGLAAGVRLASQGVRVTIIEEAPRLGGRATAFTDRESGLRLDNGQHALFGCYRETYDFLHAIGTADLAPLDPTLTLTMADVSGRASTLTCPPLRPPLHLIRGVLSWKAIPLGDRPAALRLAGLVWRVRREGAAAAAAWVPSHLTVVDWLRQQRQPRSLCEWLWHPLAYAALNQDPAIAAAQPFVRVVGELFGASPEASAIGLPRVPLDELYAEPAARFIEAHGGLVRRRVTARVELDPSGGRHRVLAGEETLTPEAVISAVPWQALNRLWHGPPPASLASIVEAAARLGSAPIVTVTLWLDRPVMSGRQVGLIGTAFHWVFNKKELGSLSTEAGRPPSHLVSLVASGAEALLRQSNEELAVLAERELRMCLPAARSATCLRSLVVREARATFSLAPDVPPRPPAETPVRGFFLAGDWTDTGLPGTIESGVMSGHRAADAAMGLTGPMIVL